MSEDEPQPGRAGVTLQIDHLVIDGVKLNAGQSAQLQLSLQRELTRLLARDGLGPSPAGIALPSVAAPAIQISNPLRPAELGRQIARSVHRSLIRSYE